MRNTVFLPIFQGSYGRPSRSLSQQQQQFNINNNSKKINEYNCDLAIMTDEAFRWANAPEIIFYSKFWAHGHV